MQAFLLQVNANIEPVKIMSLHYDDSSSLVYITTRDNYNDQKNLEPLKKRKLNRLAPKKLSTR